MDGAGKCTPPHFAETKLEAGEGVFSRPMLPTLIVLNPPPQLRRDMCLMIASNPAMAGFPSGTLKSQDILNRPALWPSTNLEMILFF